MTRILATALITLTVIALFSGIAVAGDETPPAIPDDPDAVPAPSGGGGGGGGGSSAPSFQPYTEALKSSDGSVVGSFDVQSYFSVIVTAANNTTIGNRTYALALRSELGNKPEGAFMDIALGSNNSSSLPVGMDDTEVLSCANVSRSGKYGWSLKEGTVTVSFTMPTSSLINQSNASQLYIVRYDGTGYQIMPAIVSNGSDGTVTLSAPVPSDYGVFAAVLASPAKPEPVATPTPTPTPTPVTTLAPTPAPAEDKGIFGWLMGLFGG